MLRLFLIALLGLIGFLPASAAPARKPGVKATACAACHGKDKVLPAGHPDLKKAAACATCHAGEKTLRGKLDLAHRHGLAGIDCAACHGKGKPAKVAPATCTACHDLEALAAKTAQAKDHNPHADQHGYAKNCNLCHHAHKKPANYCLTCHSFNWPVP